VQQVASGAGSRGGLVILALELLLMRPSAASPWGGEEPPNWPRLKREGRSDVPKKGLAVLLGTGGMNPVHLGHVQMLHQAAARLEAEGYGVVGAYLSPTHDNYLQPKAQRLRTIGLSGSFRLEVARRTVEHDSLVSASGWEIAQRSFVDFPDVAHVLQDELPEKRVFYVAGTDHAERCGLLGGMGGKIGLVIVPREGDSVPEEVYGQVYVAAPAGGDVASFSSTEVRNALQRRDLDYVSKALSPLAAKFLLDPSPEEKQRFEADFSKLGLFAK